MIDVSYLNEAKFQRTYAAGQQITSAGGRELYIVVSGSVKLSSAGQSAAVGAGESFGVREFFTGRQLFTFTAAESTVLFVVSEANFDEVAAACPKVLYWLLGAVYVPGFKLGPRAGDANKTAVQQPDAEAVRNIIKQKLNSQVDQGSVAKVRDAFRQKYAMEKQGGSGDAAIKEFPKEIYPEGHKSYPDVIRPEQHKFLLKTEYKCPNCGQKFQGTKVLASKLVPAQPTRYDLRKYFIDFSPEWYELQTCPHCYFTIFSELYGDASKLAKNMVKDPLGQARSVLSLDFEAERDIDFVFTMHYLALQCAKGYGNRAQLERRLWAGVSWLYEDMSDDEMMRYACAQAARAAEKVYQESQLNTEQEQAIRLSAGAMLYRADGDRERTVKHLIAVIGAKEGKKTYINLAQTLMDILREERQG